MEHALDAIQAPWNTLCSMEHALGSMEHGPRSVLYALLGPGNGPLTPTHSFSLKQRSYTLAKEGGQLVALGVS